MLRTLAGCVREYRRPTVISLVFIVLEAIIETFIPFITANLVNSVKAGAEIGEILATGGLLVVMAACSLTSGGVAGIACARASSGFAKNLRSDMYRRIGTYGFENIDKFSTSSLVTRMTTDVQNVQMSYMVIIRTAIRAPLMLVFSMVMAFVMGGLLALSFVVLIPLLTFGLLLVARFAMPAFRRVFRKYDRLNESIEE
ncbi:MAG: ABC transporter ATP-binding protein, partial [Clostridia bacterium]|nr:ABC transporter ATP-binding protein [Clostridia bacterium]